MYVYFVCVLYIYTYVLHINPQETLLGYHDPEEHKTHPNVCTHYYYGPSPFGWVGIFANSWRVKLKWHSGGCGVKFKGQLSGSGTRVGKIQVAAPSEEPPKEFLPAQSTLLARLLDTEMVKHNTGTQNWNTKLKEIHGWKDSDKV